MLTRRATAYSSSCSQVVLVHLQSFKVCTAAENRKKITKKLYFGGSRLFKVIDVNITKKLVSRHQCLL